MNRTMRGFSLIEGMIVLMVVAIILAGVGAYAKRSSEEQKAAQFVDSLLTMMNNLRARYQAQENYAGLTATSAIADGVVPPDLVASATTLQTSWGSALALTTGDISVGLDPAAGTPSGFQIQFSFQNASTCGTAIAQLIPRVKFLQVVGYALPGYYETPTTRFSPSQVGTFVAAACGNAVGGPALSARTFQIIDG